MRRSLPFKVMLLALVAMLTGCVTTELRVKNLTGGSIQLYSGHTQKTALIPVGATVTVPHTAGKVSIAMRDVVWTYESLNIPDFTSETTKGFKRLTLPITVNREGTISLPSGHKIEPSYTNYH